MTGPEEFDPREEKDAIIELFARNGLPEIRELFDWYYSWPETTSWVLRAPDRQPIGMCSVQQRGLGFGEIELRAGILGNIVVDRDHRTGLAFAQLLRAVQHHADSSQVDLIVGRPGESALGLASHLGFRRIGQLQGMVRFKRVPEQLRGILGLFGRVLAPVADAWLSGLHRRRCRAQDVPPSRWIGKDEVTWEDVRRWRYPSSMLTSIISPQVLMHRRHKGHGSASVAIGIPAADSSLRGLIIADVRGSEARILECQVDGDFCSPAKAIGRAACLLLDRVHVVRLDCLKGSDLARTLGAEGFFARPEEARLAGYWRPDHPLASEFAMDGPWAVLGGFNDV